MADDNLMSQDEIERLLNQASPPTGGPAPASGSGPPAAQLPADQPPPSPTPSAPATATAQSAESSDSSKLLGQEDIDKILGNPASPALAKAEPHTVAGPSPDDGNLAPADLDYLLNQAEQALASVQSGSSTAPPPGVAAFRLEELNGAPPSQDNATLDLIRDVELDLKIELGRTNMYLEDVLRLRKGSVVPLDKLAGDPVDIYVNDRLVARGEVLVLNDNFCVRVAELIAGVSPAA
jgi:flagellar motor switch protein FliN